MISQMKEQIEMLNGQVDKYQRFHAYASNRMKRLEAEINDLNANLEKSNKKNKEPLSFEKEGLEAEIISLKEDLEESNNKNERLEAKIISLKEDPEKSNKKN